VTDGETADRRRRGSRHRLSLKDLEQLRDRWVAGEAWTDLAAERGMSGGGLCSAVRRRLGRAQRPAGASRLGGRRSPRLSLEELEQLRDRWVAGETWDELAAECGMSGGGLYGAVRTRLGIAQRPDPQPAVLVGVDLGWLAGMIEARGSIQIALRDGGRQITTVTVSSADEERVRRVRKLAGVGTVTQGRAPAAGGPPVWSWRVGAHAHVQHILQTVYPLLVGGQRERVAAALEFLADHPVRHRARAAAPAPTVAPAGPPPDPSSSDGLPRLMERPAGSTLVTRGEAGAMLGYSATSLATLMHRHPDRWPDPVALLRVGRVWQKLWNAAELRAAAPPTQATERRGARATVSDPDGLLTCLECNIRLRGLTAAEYRERHRLPATGALQADGLRQAGSERQRAILADDPAALDHLRPWQDPSHLDAIRSAAVETHHETRGRPLVRAHRAPGQRAGVQAMLDSRQAKLDATAVAAGYESLEDAVRRTADLSAREAAARVGVGESTVRRWRAKLAQP